MPAQSLPSFVLSLDFAAECRVTKRQVVLVTGVLPVPLDSMDVAEWTTTVAALHNWLTFPTAVYLRCTTAEWAPHNVGGSQGDLLKEELLVPVFTANLNE